MTVTIDDRLPYWKRPWKHGNLCFAKQTKENEFWPCLLEKAVAKFVMSYHRIDGGFESSALETCRESQLRFPLLVTNGYYRITVSNLRTSTP